MPISRMAVKRAIKRVAGHACVALSPCAAPPKPAACILVYHRVADIRFDDPDLDSWNVAPGHFAAHMAALARSAEVVPLQALPGLLDAPSAPARPRVCVTFDDGFASVYTEALPILRRYGIPATAFIVTGYLGGDRPMPFDRWSNRNRLRTPRAARRSMSWREVEECAASGLIEIGGHSHQHRDGRCCSAEHLVEETAQCRAILKARLGEEHTRSYAYPYGSTRLGEVPASYVDAVKQAGYERAVSTDLGLVTRTSDPYRLP